MPSLSLIVAMTQDRVIGKNNQLPWHLPEDLKRFKQITMGHALIMGRKTFESIGKPLPGRQNIVISRNPAFKKEGIETVQSLDQALSLAKGNEAFVIGGAEIFKQALPRADKVHLTLILSSFEGDVFFPEIDWEKDFNTIQKSPNLVSTRGLPYQFIELARK